MNQTEPQIRIKKKENPSGERTIDVDAPNATMRLVLGTNGDTRISLSDKEYPSNCVRLQNYLKGEWRVTNEHEWPQNKTKVAIDLHKDVFQGSVAGVPVFYVFLKDKAFVRLQWVNAEKKIQATVDANGKITSQSPDVSVSECSYTPQGFPKPADKSPEA